MADIKYEIKETVADVLDIKFEQAFILPDGNEIKTGNMTKK